MSVPAHTETHLAHPKYRSDIDGLRAIAVLAVVGFHAFPTLVKGGFIGVDIFFVISGYLISTIIFENLDKDSFSFLVFYGRRIRRIFPALLLVLAACFSFGWLVLTPGEYRQLGRHIAGGAGFISNFTLWKESGYFDSVADTKPLLHLWSLGIEEQFYIVWPLLLWVAYKYKFNKFLLLVLIAAISFYLNLENVSANAVATFYSPLTRFWELLVGSLFAYATLYGRMEFEANKGSGARWVESIASSQFLLTKETRFGSTISALGFTAIAIGVTLITKDKHFPGAWALLPTLGAAMIILPGPQAWLNRWVLSNRVLVWFGLISFPLYLWHWPLLSFARIVENEMPNLEVRIGAVAISILLAWLTYELIEKPIRFGKFGKVKAITLLLSMCVVGGVGVGTQKGYFYPRSHSLAALQYFEFSGYPAPDGEYVEDKYKFGAIGNNETDKILLIGDSHSEQYRNTLAKLLAAQSATGHIQPQVMYSLDYLGPDGLLQTSKKVLEDRTISTVIISNFWALTYGSDKINYAIRCCGNALGGSVGGDAYHEPQTSEQMAEIDIKVETVARSLIESGKKVYLILDNPFGEELAPRSLVSRSFFNGVKVRTTPLSKDKAVQRAEPARSRIIGIARRTGAKIIDPFDYLCDQETCPSLSSDGTPIYKDYDHLSIYAVTHRVNYLDFALHK